MRKIAIIPARGGSKRIPRKNIKDFYGKPIISYSIEAAIKSQSFDEVMVSTDDKEIAEISKKYGASVPFFRTVELSDDSAATLPVLLEVLDEYLKRNKDFTHGCCIYPCTPLITSEMIKMGMELLVTHLMDTVIPVIKFSYPPQRGISINNGLIQVLYPEVSCIRTQDMEPIYRDAGQFYCFSIDSIRKQRTLFCRRSMPIVLSELEVQDIDNADDWDLAKIKYSLKNPIKQC